MENGKKLPTPPYVPYRTLKNFLEKFKQGVPGRIDRDLMGTMSGAAQSQVTTALKYLGFISENNLPQEKMKAYVAVEGEERKKVLKEILEGAYPFVFEGSFNLATATASQLRESFEAKTSATGETVSRCIAFFKDAAHDAGIKVSPYITQKKPRNGAGKKTRAAQSSPKPAANTEEFKQPHDSSHTQHPPIEAQSSLLLWGLFQRLPKPGSVWPKEQRDQWTQTLNNVLALEYKDQ